MPSQNWEREGAIVRTERGACFWVFFCSILKETLCCSCIEISFHGAFVFMASQTPGIHNNMSFENNCATMSAGVDLFFFSALSVGHAEF